MAKFALACTSIISSSVLVRCLLFPTLQLFRCFPGGAGRAIASANGAKESISWPAFHVKASHLDFSRHALTMAGEGRCENISASGVRSIPGATTSYMVRAVRRQGACAPVIDCVVDKRRRLNIAISIRQRVQAQGDPGIVAY
jgi:hypothetical protein